MALGFSVWTLELQADELLSSFALSFNLRHYTQAAGAEAKAAADAGKEAKALAELDAKAAADAAAAEKSAATKAAAAEKGAKAAADKEAKAGGDLPLIRRTESARLYDNLP
jgi:hypothetical protein